MSPAAESLALAPALRQLAREAAAPMTARKRREHVALALYLMTPDHPRLPALPEAHNQRSD